MNKLNKLRLDVSHFVLQCQRKLPSVVHFAMPRSVFQFCLTDFMALPAKIKFKKKLKEFRFTLSKSVTGDFKSFADNKFASASNSVFHNYDIKAHGIFVTYCPEPNIGMMDEIGNVFY